MQRKNLVALVLGTGLAIAGTGCDSVKGNVKQQVPYYTLETLRKLEQEEMFFASERKPHSEISHGEFYENLFAWEAYRTSFGKVLTRHLKDEPKVDYVIYNDGVTLLVRVYDYSKYEKTKNVADIEFKLGKIEINGKPLRLTSGDRKKYSKMLAEIEDEISTLRHGKCINSNTEIFP